MSIFGIFIIALIMSFAFSPYKKNNPVAPLILLFFILLLSGLAAQYWVIPFGPRGWGISWLPVLIMMFVFGLLFSSPSRRSKKVVNVEQQEEVASDAIGVFVWIILFILLAVVIAGIYRAPDAALV
jgi:hypothetical protein